MKNLKVIRAEQNISQDEMCRELGIPKSTYSMYENGKRNIPYPVANNIAKILKVKKEDIFLPTKFTTGK